MGFGLGWYVAVVRVTPVTIESCPVGCLGVLPLDDSVLWCPPRSLSLVLAVVLVLLLLLVAVEGAVW